LHNSAWNTKQIIEKLLLLVLFLYFPSRLYWIFFTFTYLSNFLDATFNATLIFLASYCTFTSVNLSRYCWWTYCV